jgi:hypothetical protein
LGRAGETVPREAVAGGVEEGENLVMMSSTVDVDVHEKETASTFPGDVEMISVCGEGMIELG